MSGIDQIPRNSLAWLLLAQGALIAPHAQRLPVWVLISYGVCLFWRLMVHQGRWSFPGKPIKFLLIFSCFAGIYLSYGVVIGLEPTVALLMSGFALKLIEASHQRDVYVLIFLGYFVGLTAFLFSQDMGMVLYMLLAILLMTSALTALHQVDEGRINFASFKKSLLLFAQAIPLMAVLFIVFPRFSPLWKVPLPSHQAKTGITDSMSPGDISSLSKSTELAFRVQFNGEIPPVEQLYWRGLVLTEFDGRRWQPAQWNNQPMFDAQRRELRQSMDLPVSYSIIQEASYQPWLFSLRVADTTTPYVLVTRDYRLVAPDDIHARMKYDVVSSLSVPVEVELDARHRKLALKLPATGNQQARMLAQKLYRESGSDRHYINRVLTRFNQQNFIYTLEPGVLGNDYIDDFLFSSRRGFCSHYASSFVFLMRAAGLPARVVTGYQGGETNPITQTVLVHQFDAHAWAEVWLPGEGWLRIDPTASVAPERVERGIEQAMRGEGSFLADSPLSPMRYRHIVWLNKLRLRLDAMEYYWSRWVLQYRGDTQLTFLKKLLGEVSPLRVASLLIAVGSVVVLVVCWQLFRGNAKPPLALELVLYNKLCEKAAKKGFTRRPHEGPMDFANRVSEADPQLGRELIQITRSFIAIAYQPIAASEKSSQLDAFSRSVRSY